VVAPDVRGVLRGGTLFFVQSSERPKDSGLVRLSCDV
jgi:hypothetical protein